jgi:drug/metabolite transporter (DMT)-like permease
VNTKINTSMTLLEWSMLLALSLLWGGSFFFVGVAVAELPPFTIVLLRVGLAAAVLWLVVEAMGMRMPATGGLWPAFFGMGVLNNLVPFSLIVWGQTHIASGLASILNATTPLFTVIVAHVLTADERMTGTRLAGVIAGLAGVAVMMGPTALQGIGANVMAQAAVLTAALSYALAGIYGRRFKRMGVPPLLTATGQVTASTILLAPLTLMVDRPWSLPMPGMETWAALIGLAILSTALAYILYFRILATAGATNLLLVTFLIPVIAIVLGVAVLGERPGPEQVLGMALIGAGLAAIDGRLANTRAARVRGLLSKPPA